MRHALALALALCVSLAAIAACGPLDDIVHGRRPGSGGGGGGDHPHAVQSWQGSQQLAANKATVVAACHQGGASDATVSLVLAALMQESTDADASQRDTSKDGSDAKNWSAFNMNSAFLKKIGWVEGQGPDLNDQANLAAATGWFLKGLRDLTEDGALNFHRGGQSGFENPQLYQCDDYRAQMRQVQQYLMDHRECWTNGQRIGGFVPHV